MHLVNCFRFCFHPKLLKVVDTSKMAIEIGDFVWVIKSYLKVRALQDDRHGGWTEEMREVRYYSFVLLTHVLSNMLNNKHTYILYYI